MEQQEGHSLHCHGRPAPHQKARFQVRLAPPSLVLQGLQLIHRAVELDPELIRRFSEVGVFLSDQHFDIRKCREGEKTRGGGGGLERVSNWSSGASGDPKAVEVRGHVAAVQGAVGLPGTLGCHRSSA